MAGCTAGCGASWAAPTRPPTWPRTLSCVCWARRSADLGEPRALLTHIAKGLVVDHWRRRAVEQAYLEVLARLPEAQAPSPETRLLVLEALCRVDAMLAGLPPKTRKIFLLSQLDSLTYGAIAERLGTSLITVKRHMRNGFIACMAALED